MSQLRASNQTHEKPEQKNTVHLRYTERMPHIIIFRELSSVPDEGFQIDQVSCHLIDGYNYPALDFSHRALQCGLCPFFIVWPYNEGLDTPRYGRMRQEKFQCVLAVCIVSQIHGTVKRRQEQIEKPNRLCPQKINIHPEDKKLSQ
jgi:hypothetical protein